MQNKQSTLQKLTTNFMDRYEDFFLGNDRPTLTTVERLPQMPLFQIQHFLNQAMKQNLIVNIQLEPATSDGQLVNVFGHIVSDQHGHRQLKTAGNVTYVLKPEQIRYVSKK